MEVNNLNKDRKNILIYITHSIGELDVILPLLTRLKSNYHLNVEIVFVVKKLYVMFINNKFYNYCTKLLNINITYSQLPNKFDFRDVGLRNTKLGRIILLIFMKLMAIFQFPFHLKKLISCDIYMHEYTNQTQSTIYMYLMASIFNKKIFAYHHGHTINLDTKFFSNVENNNKTVYLNFHEHNNEYVKQLPYTKQKIIGYPKFFKEWIALINRYYSSNSPRSDIVLIFTRGLSPVYMDRNKYEILIISAYKVIRDKLKNMPIVIKTHPREDHSLLLKIINDKKLENISISDEHAGVLSKSALLVISFWTSAILDSLSLGIPSIEYYIESNNFRSAEPAGSVFKKIGIHSTDNERVLGEFVETVLNGRYLIPPIIQELSKNPNLNFL